MRLIIGIPFSGTIRDNIKVLLFYRFAKIYAFLLIKNKNGSCILVLGKKILQMQIDFLMLSRQYELLRRCCPVRRSEILMGGSRGKEGIEK